MKFAPQKGFSLVELAIVIMVVGLLLGSTIVGLSDFIWHARNAQARKDLALIEEALIGFVISNGGLPCPDTNGYPNTPNIANGVADAGGVGGCSDEDGFLPWADLGVKARDPWGAPYLYRLDTIYAKPPPIINNNVNFNLTSGNGNIDVMSAGGAGTIADNLVAIFFSVGPNGFEQLVGAAVASADENENFDDDVTFIDRAYLAPTAGNSGYDDILHWVSSFTLKAKMVQSQRLP